MSSQLAKGDCIQRTQ